MDKIGKIKQYSLMQTNAEGKMMSLSLTGLALNKYFTKKVWKSHHNNP